MGSKDFKARMILDTGQFRQELDATEKRANKVRALIEKDSGVSATQMRGGMFAGGASSAESIADARQWMLDRKRAMWQGKDSFDAQLPQGGKSSAATLGASGKEGGDFSFRKLGMMGVAGVEVKAAVEGLAMGFGLLAAATEVARGRARGFNEVMSSVSEHLPIVGNAVKEIGESLYVISGAAARIDREKKAMDKEAAYGADRKIYSEKTMAARKFRESEERDAELMHRSAAMSGKDAYTRARMEAADKIKDKEEETEKEISKLVGNENRKRGDMLHDDPRIVTLRKSLDKYKEGVAHELSAAQKQEALSSARELESLESDHKAHILDIVGKHADAEKERIHQSYQDRIEEAQKANRQQLVDELTAKRDLEMATVKTGGSAAQITRQYASYGGPGTQTVNLGPAAMALLQKQAQRLGIGVIGRAGP